jgi:Pyruvate/2-oxoacid:ferredoxin oxidoreductase delta subunit
VPYDSDPGDGPKCAKCGADIRLRVMVPHHIWELLRPKYLPADVKLCCECVVRCLEKHVTGRGKVWLELEESERCLGQPPAPINIHSEDPDFKEKLSQVIKDAVDYTVTSRGGLVMSGGPLSVGRYDGYCKGCSTCRPESSDTKEKSD